MGAALEFTYGKISNMSECASEITDEIEVMNKFNQKSLVIRKNRLKSLLGLPFSVAISNLDVYDNLIETMTSVNLLPNLV